MCEHLVYIYIIYQFLNYMLYCILICMYITNLYMYDKKKF